MIFVVQFRNTLKKQKQDGRTDYTSYLIQTVVGPVCRTMWKNYIVKKARKQIFDRMSL